MKKLFILLAISFALVGCGNKNSDENLANTDGHLYTVTTDGYGGDIFVTIKVLDNKIIDIIAQGENETQNIGTIALDQLPPAILKTKKTNVDVVGGATVTSNAIIDGINKAIELSNASF